MPGRLAAYNDTEWKRDLSSLFDHFNDRIGTLTPSFNIAPTQAVATLLNNGDYLYTHFGLIPSWAREKKSLQINARSENLFERKTFTDSFRYRRCLILVNGWYEWELVGKDKYPYYIFSKDKSYLALAGIWDSWMDPHSGQTITSSAIITCEPNEIIQRIHNRMPVVLPSSQWETWLNPQTSLKTVYEMLIPYEQELSMHKVTPEINKVSFNSQKCIEPKVDLVCEQGTLF